MRRRTCPLLRRRLDFRSLRPRPRRCPLQLEAVLFVGVERKRGGDGGGNGVRYRFLRMSCSGALFIFWPPSCTEKSYSRDARRHRHRVLVMVCLRTRTRRRRKSHMCGEEEEERAGGIRMQGKEGWGEDGRALLIPPFHLILFYFFSWLQRSRSSPLRCSYPSCVLPLN